MIQLEKETSNIKERIDSFIQQIRMRSLTYNGSTSDFWLCEGRNTRVYILPLGGSTFS
jgi:hypothetical protein